MSNNNNNNNNKNKNSIPINNNNNRNSQNRRIIRSNRRLVIRRNRIMMNNLNRRRNILNRNVNNNVIKTNRPKNVLTKFIDKNNKNTIITGKDLLLEVNNEYPIQSSGVLAIIPINPLYWENTRIKNLSVQYQYYQPKQISIEYVPIVSKFQQGTITIGCISNPILNNQSIQNTLISSTSGESFSCSEFYRKNLAINSLMTQKKLLLSNKINSDSNPFFIVIYLSGVLNNDNQLIMPGSFYINYSIHLFNPITNPLSFKVDRSKLLSDFDLKQQNITCVLMEENNKYGPGTLINIEKTTGSYKYIYNGSQIELDTNKRATFLYSSIPTLVEPDYDVIDLSNFQYADVSVNIDIQPQGQETLIISPDDLFWAFYKNNNTNITIRVEIKQGDYYLIGANALSGFQGAAVEVNYVTETQGYFQNFSGIFRNCYFENLQPENDFKNVNNPKILKIDQKFIQPSIKELKDEFEKLNISETKSEP